GVLADAGGEADLALALEHVGDRAVGTQVATALGEGMADFGRGAIAVVGHGLDDDRHAAGGVALIAELDDVVGFVVTGAAGNGAIDDVSRHVVGQRLVHGQAQARVVRRHWAAVLG